MAGRVGAGLAGSPLREGPGKTVRTWPRSWGPPSAALTREAFSCKAPQSQPSLCFLRHDLSSGRKQDIKSGWLWPMLCP